MSEGSSSCASQGRHSVSSFPTISEEFIGDAMSYQEFNHFMGDMGDMNDVNLFFCLTCLNMFGVMLRSMLRSTTGIRLRSRFRSTLKGLMTSVSNIIFCFMQNSVL
ncbi:unnamed protein product [Cuscuta campestris]|uniref:Uncharacterized protein n=1 Tax=Cuscuta campestris TaxID=132261 RepID=A0A484KYZ5_9ASTE|nr:unnamed protein product [Cuscuta campestris]